MIQKEYFEYRLFELNYFKLKGRETVKTTILILFVERDAK